MLYMHSKILLCLKNKNLSFVTTWINLEYIVLKKLAKLRKNITHSHLCEESKTLNS
jgi:hypothetical protein